MISWRVGVTPRILSTGAPRRGHRHKRLGAGRYRWWPGL